MRMKLLKLEANIIVDTDRMVDFVKNFAAFMKSQNGNGLNFLSSITEDREIRDHYVNGYKTGNMYEIDDTGDLWIIYDIHGSGGFDDDIFLDGIVLNKDHQAFTEEFKLRAEKNIRQFKCVYKDGKLITRDDFDAVQAPVSAVTVTPPPWIINYSVERDAVINHKDLEDCVDIGEHLKSVGPVSKDLLQISILEVLYRSKFDGAAAGMYLSDYVF